MAGLLGTEPTMFAWPDASCPSPTHGLWLPSRFSAGARSLSTLLRNDVPSQRMWDVPMRASGLPKAEVELRNSRLLLGAKIFSFRAPGRPAFQFGHPPH